MDTPKPPSTSSRAPRGGRTPSRKPLFVAAFLLALTAAGASLASPTTLASTPAPAASMQTDSLQSTPALTPDEDPAADPDQLQSHPRCEMRCRTAFVRCVNRIRGECGGDIQCLRDRGNGCMDNYRGCRQDSCGSSADDIPLPRLPF